MILPQFQFTLHFAIPGVTAVFAAITTLVAWKRRTAPASQFFVGLMVAITGYATVAALEAGSIALSNKIFWSKMEYVGTGSIIVFFLIFTLRFTHPKIHLKTSVGSWLWVIPIFNMLLAATNEWHHLVWINFLPGAPGSNMIVYQHGPGYYWTTAWIYIYVLCGCLLLTKAIFRSSRLHRRQAGLILIGAVIPMIGGSLYVLKITPPSINITPMSFLLTGLVFLASLRFQRTFDLIPIARDQLVESMEDGVLVVDIHNRVIDLNPAAEKLVGTRTQWVGQPIHETLQEWPELALLCSDRQGIKAEILLELSRMRWIKVRSSPLCDLRGSLTGRLIILHDMTQHYQVEMELRQANARLQQQLIAIEKLQNQLREQAIRDGLTNLFNRRYLEQTLLRELAQAARNNQGVAVILLDVDYFKRINDTFGHKAGDRVLQAFANLLSQSSRVGDIACRYGGEEFALVFPGMELDAAYQRTDQIRRSFENLRVSCGGIDIQATVSGGIALFPRDGTTSDDLLNRADQALYAAKAAGRNCIKVSQ